MSEKVTIYVCPNGCHAGLTCAAETMQTWRVNAQCEPIEEIDSDEPDFDCNMPHCAKCGEEADEIECYAWPLLSGEAERLGVVYVSVDRNDCVWVCWAGDCVTERIPCQDLTNGITLNGTRYYLNEDGFAPMKQVNGQLSLLDGSVYAVNGLEEEALCPLF